MPDPAAPVSKPSLFLERCLPYLFIRNVWVFYIQSACIGSFFCAAVWLFVWLKYLTLGEVGVVDWIAVVAAWFAEVPSGVLADKLGRKWLVVLAFITSGLGIILQGLATAWPLFLLSNILYLVGFSFHSGAAEALVYESLDKELLRYGHDRDHAYEQVISTGNAVQLVMHVVSILLGTWSYNHFGETSPFLIQGVVSMLGAFVGLWAIETVSASARQSKVSALETLKLSIGSVQLISKALVPVAIIAAAVVGLYDLCAWSFMRTAIATKFGFEHEGYAIILNLGIIASAIAIRLLPQIRGVLGDQFGFPAIGALLGLSFIFSSLDLGAGGSVALALMIMSGLFIRPWMSILINKGVEDHHRATMISLFGFITRLQFLILGLVVPWLAGKGYFDAALLSLGIVAVGASVLSWYLGRDIE